MRKAVIVIGGGPAGLMAAGQAAVSGKADVTLLEKKPSPARKLRITGNGRCNLTNTAPIDDFISHFGRYGKFLLPAFSKFFSRDLMNFFEGLGVRLTIDDRGRVYPASGDANQIADALITWALKRGAVIKADSAAGEIITARDMVTGVRLKGRGGTLPADTVIIATGGASYPGTGSSGDGYRLAESLGHTIAPIRPSSVPLLTSGETTRELKGLSLPNIAARLTIGRKIIHRAAGDLLFTHYGVSGPMILSLSGVAVDQLRAGHQPVLSLDLLPALDSAELDRHLLARFREHGKSQIHTALAALVPQRMASLILRELGIEPAKVCNVITSEERHKIRQRLKDFELEVVGHRPLAEAMVTAGGVSLREVDPRSMESRLVRGLYFAGEVLDLDADTGGFNLQAAFSTGYLAGLGLTFDK